MNKDRKALLKFIGIILISAVCGGIIGFCSSYFDIGDQDKIETVYTIIHWIGVVGLYVSAIYIFIGILQHQKAKKQIALISDEDEDLFNKVDAALGSALNKTIIGMVGMLLCFGISISIDISKWPALLSVSVIVFLVVYFFAAFYQARIIKSIKELYPEKNGNVFDLSFQKDWMASCDEAEKQKIGQAAYVSYRKTSTVTMIIFVICLFLENYLKFGPVPLLLIGIIMLTQNITYLREANRLDRNSKQINK